MELAINEAVGIHNALKVLYQQMLAAKLQYYVARNTAKLEQELKPFYETRQDLAESHGATVDPATGRLNFPDSDGREAFTEEIEDLAEETIEVDLAPIKLAWLEDVNTTGRAMSALLNIIEEDDA